MNKNLELALELIKQEGDKKDFVYKDYKCHIIRHKTFGNLCGYIDIPLEHKLYDVHYDDIDVYVHGGLTYNGIGIDGIPSAYVIGFDCAHYGDLSPYLEMRFPEWLRVDSNDIYRDMDYVENELKNAVDQIIEKYQ